MSEDIISKLEEADALFSAWHLDDALVKYQEALEASPHSWAAINRVARIHALRGRVQAFIDVSVRWLDLLEDEGQVELAGVVAESALACDPNSVQARMGLLRHVERTEGEEQYVMMARQTARYFVEVGAGELSIQILNSAREKYPQDMTLAIELADMHFAQGNMQDAIKLFRSIADRYEQAGDRVHAADAYRRLKFLLPDSTDVSLRLGHIYSENGRLDEAVAEFRAVLRSSYDNEDALQGLADALVAQESYDDAILAYRKILVVQPGMLEVRERLAGAYEKKDMIEDAVKELLTAAQFLMQERSLNDAKRVFEKIVQLNPGNPVAVRELSNIKADFEAQEARAAKLSAMAARPQAGMAAQAPVAVASDAAVEHSVASSSDDDLYGDDEGEGLLGGDTLLGALDDTLPGVESTGDSRSVAASTGAVEVGEGAGSYTCVLPVEAAVGALLVPVPFLVAQFPDLIPLMVQEIAEPPEQELIGWKTLEKREAPAAAVVDGAGTETVEVAIPTLGTSADSGAPAGPIQSRFGSDGGFTNAVASGGSRASRWRRAPYDFYPPRGRRGGKRDNKAEALAERIRNTASANASERNGED